MNVVPRRPCGIQKPTGKSELRMRSKAFGLVLALAAVAGGCQDMVKPPDSKAEAKKQWSDARAAVLVSLAQDQYNTGNFDKCRETLDKALMLEPSSEPAHILSARCAIEQGNLELADKELSVARSLSPNDAAADYLSGVVYQRWQQPQKSYDFYDAACKKSPTELAYLMAKAEMLVAMDRSKEALTLLLDKVTYFEHSAVIRDAVGMLLKEEGRNDEAVAMLREASILAEDELSIREHLALALFADKRYSEAADVLNRLLDKDPYSKRPDLFMALGECQLQTGRPTDARGSFETACDLKPASPDAYLAIAKVALQLKDDRRAEISLRKGLALAPNSSEGNLLLGYMRLRQSKLPEALSAFNKASQCNKSDTVSLCMIGYVLEKLGKPDQAMRYYAKALKIKPNDEMAATLMADVGRD